MDRRGPLTTYGFTRRRKRQRRRWRNEHDRHHQGPMARLPARPGPGRHTPVFSTNWPDTKTTRPALGLAIGGTSAAQTARSCLTPGDWQTPWSTSAGCPEAGEAFHLVTRGAYSLWHVVKAALSLGHRRRLPTLEWQRLASADRTLRNCWPPWTTRPSARWISSTPFTSNRTNARYASDWAMNSQPEATGL